MDVSELVRTEFGIGMVDDILGYHGTSADAILLLQETGKFPDTGIRPGYFCVIPVENGVGDTIWYARQIAVRHFLAGALPFEPPTHHHIVAV